MSKGSGKSGPGFMKNTLGETVNGGKEVISGKHYVQLQSARIRQSGWGMERL